MIKNIQEPSFKLIAYFTLALTSNVAHAQIVQHTVAGNSMEPTLSAGAQVDVNLQAYVAAKPVRGELVSIRFGNRLRPMVKRVVAVGGEHVRFDQNGLWRKNDLIVSEERLKHARKGLALRAQLENYNNMVPKGSVIVLGDNPRSSKDSLRYGLVSLSQIEGKVEAVNGMRIPMHSN